MTDWYTKLPRTTAPSSTRTGTPSATPTRLVYRTYNILQDGQETYVDGLLEQYSGEEHDAALPDLGTGWRSSTRRCAIRCTPFK